MLCSLQRLVTEHRPSLLFISESKVSKSVGKFWKSALIFSGGVAVEALGCSGGLLLFWNDLINVTLKFYSSRYIN